LYKLLHGVLRRLKWLAKISFIPSERRLFS
jgi:hypothetical protein